MMSSTPQYTTPLPTLAAFLVGDSVGFVPKPWPRDKFKEALVDTIQDFGDPWVICECIESPHDLYDQNWLTVTKMTMEAINECYEMQTSKRKREQCKACIQEGCVEDVDAMKWEKARSDDNQNTFCLIGITEEEKMPVVLSNKRMLPDQFKHFPDEVKKQHFETVQETMLFLEEKLSQTMVTSLKLNEKEGKEFKMKIPTIVMVVEGDFETIDHVAKAVEKNIPVLLVRGSGMAADLIGYCLEEEDVLETRAPLLFGICFSKENFDSLEKNIKIIQKNRSKVTEFNILTESVTSLKDKVTESIIRTWAMVHVKEGERAATITDFTPDISPVAFSNGVPSAATYTAPSHNFSRRVSKIVPLMMPISNEAVRPKSSRPATMPSSSELYSSPTGGNHRRHTCVPNRTDGNRKVKPSPLALHMLYQMLQTNQALVTGDKVEGRSSGPAKNELLKSGQSLLGYALQENLYDITELLVDKGVKLQWSENDRGTTGKSDGKSLFEKIRRERKTFQDNQSRTSIADIIKLPKDDKFPKLKRGVWEVGSEIISYKIDTTSDSDEEKDANCMTSSDLLLWAVLTNKMEMAEIFWKRSHEPILTALIASAILRKMSRRAHSFKEQDMENKMLLHSRVFRQRAIDVTQRFYENNEQEAIFVLERENKRSVWGIKESALEFSQAHNIYEFVAHHVPQRSFNRIWYGGDFFHHKTLYDTEVPVRTCCKLRFHNFNTFLAVMFTAPIVKFIIHYLFFCMFLVCLSAFVMTNITEHKWPIDTKSIYEYCAYLWLFADIVEEYGPPVVYTIKQHLHPLHWKRRAWNHMHNFWNGMDFLSYLVIITGICFRFAYEKTDFGISRRLYSVGLFLMFMRYLHVLLIWRRIGPTIIMLKEGLKELMRFVVIMAVFIFSAGVFYHANLYPNHYDMFSTFGMQYWSIWKIVYYPYWSIYGEFKSEIDGEDSTGSCSFNQTVYMNDPNIVRCPEKDWMVSLMSGFFVLILNLLLVNLIIAMFSFRFEEIKNDSDKYWRFHRSQVIMEFRKRIPVPFNLVLRPFVICCKAIRKNKEQEKEDDNTRAKLDTKQQILARRWMLSGSDAREFYHESGTSHT